MSKVIIAVPCINGNVYIKFVATSDILKLTHIMKMEEYQNLKIQMVIGKNIHMIQMVTNYHLKTHMEHIMNIHMMKME